MKLEMIFSTDKSNLGHLGQQRKDLIARLLDKLPRANKLVVICLFIHILSFIYFSLFLKNCIFF